MAAVVDARKAPLTQNFWGGCGDNFGIQDAWIRALDLEELGLHRPVTIKGVPADEQEDARARLDEWCLRTVLDEWKPPARALFFAWLSYRAYRRTDEPAMRPWPDIELLPGDAVMVFREILTSDSYGASHYYNLRTEVAERTLWELAPALDAFESEGITGASALLLATLLDYNERDLVSVVGWQEHRGQTMRRFQIEQYLKKGEVYESHTRAFDAREQATLDQLRALLPTLPVSRYFQVFHYLHRPDWFSWVEREFFS